MSEMPDWYGTTIHPLRKEALELLGVTVRLAKPEHNIDPDDHEEKWCMFYRDYPVWTMDALHVCANSEEDCWYRVEEHEYWFTEQLQDAMLNGYGVLMILTPDGCVCRMVVESGGSLITKVVGTPQWGHDLALTSLFAEACKTGVIDASNLHLTVTI